MTNLEIVHSICNILDGKGQEKKTVSYLDQVEFVQDRAGHDKRYALDVKKIKKDIGWQSKYSFESSLLETVDWYLTHYANKK